MDDRSRSARRANRYRQLTLEFRRAAKAAQTEDTRASYERLADSYEQLARSVERLHALERPTD